MTDDQTLLEALNDFEDDLVLAETIAALEDSAAIPEASQEIYVSLGYIADRSSRTYSNVC